MTHGLPILPADYYDALLRGDAGAPGMVGAPSEISPLATTPEQNAAWQQFLTMAADQLDLANTTALTWYNSMRDQFKMLDAPLMQSAAARFGLPTAWTKELDQQLLDLSTMSDLVVQWMRQAAKGERRMVVQGESWGLEALPSDDIHIAWDDASQAPVMMEGQQVIHATPQGLSGAPLVVGGVTVTWGALAVGSVLVLAVVAGLVYVVYLGLRLIAENIQGIIRAYTDKTWADCIQKATDPTQCNTAIKGLGEYQKTIDEAKPKGPADEFAKGAEATGKLATTLLLVGLGGSLIYFAVKYGPAAFDEIKASLDAKKGTRAAAGALQRASMIYRFETTNGILIHERNTWEGSVPKEGDHVTLTTMQKKTSGKIVARDTPRFRVLRRHFIVIDAMGGAPAQHQIVFTLVPD